MMLNFIQPSCRLRVEQYSQQVKFYLLIVVQYSAIIISSRHEGCVKVLTWLAINLEGLIPLCGKIIYLL